MRIVTTDYSTALQDTTVMPIILLKAQFDSGSLQLFTGAGLLEWNNEQYTGAGNLLSISDIEEQSSVEATTLTAQLSGLSTTLLNLALTENYQDREFTMWYGLLHTSGKERTTLMLDTPIPIFHGLMDVMTITEDPADLYGDSTDGTISIALTVENAMLNMHTTAASNYTSNSQKAVFPDDLGFDFIPYLQEAEITWG